MTPSLSILIPTTGRREESLRVVSCAYVAQYPDAEILTCEGFTWGAGLNHLAAKASGDYLLCACDDKLPGEGWFDAARLSLDAGVMPQSCNFTRDGAPLNPGYDDAAFGTPSHWIRDFFLTPDLFREIGPFIDTTWYADFDYSERMEVAGYPIRCCPDFRFVHLDGERDWRTPEEAEREKLLYERSQIEWEAGVSAE